MNASTCTRQTKKMMTASKGDRERETKKRNTHLGLAEGQMSARSSQRTLQANHVLRFLVPAQSLQLPGQRVRLDAVLLALSLQLAVRGRGIKRRKI